jgi:hypothetical protein
LPPSGIAHHQRMSEHTDATEDREDDSQEVSEEQRRRESDAEQPQPLAKTSSGSTDLENE